MKLTLLLVAVLSVGCTSASEKTCNTYAEMEVRCGDFPKDQHEATRKLAATFCQQALAGDDPLELKFEIECSKQHKECSAYESCSDESNDPLPNP